MTEKEFNLSEKIKEHGRVGREWYRLEVKDVKEFIRLLKDELGGKFHIEQHIIYKIIDKLAGEKLI